MAAFSPVYIAIVVAGLIIRLIVRAAKKSPTTTYRPPPQQNYNPNAQPPPFNQQSQQNYGGTQPPPFNPAQFQQPKPFTNPHQPQYHSNMGTGSQNFYCRYCGKKFQSVNALLKDTCFKHPDTSILQKHVLYQGPGKPSIAFD